MGGLPLSVRLRRPRLVSGRAGLRSSPFYRFVRFAAEVSSLPLLPDSAIPDVPCWRDLPCYVPVQARLALLGLKMGLLISTFQPVCLGRCRLRFVVSFTFAGRCGGDAGGRVRGSFVSTFACVGWRLRLRRLQTAGRHVRVVPPCRARATLPHRHAHLPGGDSHVFVHT